MTVSGYTACKISSHRPRAITFVYTNNKEILNMLSLVWGVQAYYYDENYSTEDNFENIEKVLVDKGYLVKDDFFISVASVPLKTRGKTNAIKLSRV